MTGFVICGRTFLGWSHDGRVLALQTAHNPIDCVEKILLVYGALVPACRREGCFVADIGDIGS